MLESNSLLTAKSSPHEIFPNILKLEIISLQLFDLKFYIRHSTIFGHYKISFILSLEPSAIEFKAQQASLIMSSFL